MRQNGSRPGENPTGPGSVQLLGLARISAAIHLLFLFHNTFNTSFRIRGTSSKLLGSPGDEKPRILTEDPQTTMFPLTTKLGVLTEYNEFVRKSDNFSRHHFVRTVPGTPNREFLFVSILYWKLQVTKTTTNSRFKNTRFSQNVVPTGTTC